MRGPVLPGECIAAVRALPNPVTSHLTLPFPVMPYYINREAGRYHETVDQYDTKAEALRMLPEYQMVEHGRAYYYVSTDARPGWNKD